MREGTSFNVALAKWTCRRPAFKLPQGTRYQTLGHPQTIVLILTLSKFHLATFHWLPKDKMCINDIVFVPDYCEVMKALIFSNYQGCFNDLFFFFSMSVWNQMNLSRHLLVIILLKPQSGKDCCLKFWRTCCLQGRSMCSELVCLRAKVIQWKVKLKNHKIIAKKKFLTGCFRAKDDLKKETDPFKKKVKSFWNFLSIK